jgi:hypothetical protein
MVSLKTFQLLPIQDKLVITIYNNWKKIQNNLEYKEQVLFNW